MKWHLKGLGLLWPLLMGCQPSTSDLVNRADKEAIALRSQVAQHLYLRALKKHTTPDDLRLRALIGLARVSFNQLHDYPLGMRTIDQMLREFPARNPHEIEIRSIRIQASDVARLQLQDPVKALNLIEPYIGSNQLTGDENHRLGRQLISLGQYESALINLRMAWDAAVATTLCEELRRIQMDIMEVFSIQRKCDETLKWADVQLPGGCERDLIAVEIEKAHCLELKGSADGAMKIYEDLLKTNAQNPRIHFLMANLKKRMKEKQMR